MSTPEPPRPSGLTRAPARPGRWWRSAARALLAVVLGAVIGVLGTVAHRTQWDDLPVGVVLALAITLSTAVLCRAWAGVGPLLAAGVGWVVAVQVLSVAGPGGDVLVPAQAVGLVWTYGGLAMFAVAAFLPRSWFADHAR